MGTHSTELGRRFARLWWRVTIFFRGGEIILGAGFDYLDAPVQRVSAWDIPLPYAQNLELASLPQVADIIKATKKTLYGAKL